MLPGVRKLPPPLLQNNLAGINFSDGPLVAVFVVEEDGLENALL